MWTKLVHLQVHHQQERKQRAKIKEFDLMKFKQNFTWFVFLKYYKLTNMWIFLTFPLFYYLEGVKKLSIIFTLNEMNHIIVLFQFYESALAPHSNKHNFTCFVFLNIINWLISEYFSTLNLFEYFNNTL